MNRSFTFVLMLGFSLIILTGCETTSGNNLLDTDAKHGSVSDSVDIHFKCREETKAYMGGPDEIIMFKSCMERHGYAPDGKPLTMPDTTSTSTSQ